MKYEPRFILGHWSVVEAENDAVICTCQYECTAIALAELLNERAEKYESSITPPTGAYDTFLRRR